ncbi:unnamed protein product [Toxocara canis]|nr:unnamed protein product [Toxocara canis]
MLKNAYENDKMKGHVYPDVKAVVERLSATIPIYTYSSEPVLAQKLLFSHSTDGDITPLLSGYFDNSIGFKFDSDSYRKIASEMGVPPESILFLTDSEREARAARAAGCEVRVVVRQGNEAPSDAAKQDFQLISSFNEILSLFNS